MKVYTAFNPQMEFMASLFVFEQRSIFKKVDLGTKWRKEVSQLLPNEFITSLERKEVQVTLTWIHRCIQYGIFNGDSIDDLLKWTMDLDKVGLVEELSKQIATTPPPLPIVEVYKLLDQWNNYYFSTLDPSILHSLEEKQREIESLISNYDAVEVINIVTNGLQLEGFSEDLTVTLIPQYHARPIVLYQQDRNHHFYQFSVDDIKGTNVIPPKFLRVQQALSDENRLQILKQLANNPQTFKSIHQAIGLAKSTVHHHLIALRSAGLVHLHISPTGQDYYSFREQGVKEMERRVLQYIFN
ncbi:winged helix-turn-helix domain-containing protein [Evansella sp. AB-P1]|uniref:ArsR/SmtB family transcription factor n=1 Tax=Evansella sp. AB-P1 TaxID=3037653 RepID=UPI00241CDE00|nr:winged helix-turn-helix domain-containing protein [Evansella sp. AB-P1]MDG5788940.1 winged helix-turn-helix domain-containing protein [Evansella sp. AB-P1]